MNLKDYKRALPYAEGAAETWAEWAMLYAAECHEGLQNWKMAETWMRRVSERYGHSATHWYYWCKQTGKGDARAAHELVHEHFEKLGNRKTFGDAAEQAVCCILADDHRQAVGILNVLLANAKSEALTIQAILEYDQLADKKNRDELLSKLIAGKRTPMPEWIEKRLNQDEKADPDLNGAEAALKDIPESKKCDYCFLVGQCLIQRGFKKPGLEYLQQAIASAPSHFYCYATLAAAELRRQGIEPIRSIRPFAFEQAASPPKNQSK